MQTQATSKANIEVTQDKLHATILAEAPFARFLLQGSFYKVKDMSNEISKIKKHNEISKIKQHNEISKIKL